MKLQTLEIEQYGASECEWCGWPFDLGDRALWDEAEELVTCCKACAKKANEAATDIREKRQAFDTREASTQARAEYPKPGRGAREPTEPS